MCPHNDLTGCDNFIGVEVEVTNNPTSNVIGMFEYKKYLCKECGNIVVVLNAVVERLTNG